MVRLFLDGSDGKKVHFSKITYGKIAFSECNV